MGAICTDRPGRLFSRWVSVRGLYPIPRSLYRPRGTHIWFHNLKPRGIYPLSARVVYTDRRDAHHPVAQAVAHRWRGVCTPFRGCRPFPPHGTVFQSLLECEEPTPLPACVAIPTSRDQNFRFHTSICSSVRGPYPFTRSSSVTDPRDAHPDDA